MRVPGHTRPLGGRICNRFSDRFPTRWFVIVPRSPPSSGRREYAWENRQPRMEVVSVGRRLIDTAPLDQISSADW
jgi:hypothetical protein